jgi:hypothetical protein
LRDDDAAVEAEALSLVSTMRDGHPRIEPGDRSIQRAFVLIQGLMQTDPHRPISLVHYLYFLCLAWKTHAQITEVSQALPTLLAEGCPYEQRVRTAGIPELFTIYQRCRRMIA